MPDCGFKMRAEARACLFDYIELFYNSKRRHSTIGNRSPAEYERVTRIASLGVYGTG